MEPLIPPAAPPRELRAVVLAAALSRRPAGYPDPEALPPAATPYAAEVDKLERLLRGMTQAQWRARVPATGTSVWDLVEHLSGNDAALAEALGVPVSAMPAPDIGRNGQTDTGRNRQTDTGQDGYADVGPDGREYTRRDGPPHALWRTRTQALLRHALTDPLEQPVDLAGLPLAAGNAYLVRAFETWIHADDIRGALGRPARPPRPRHLAPLADLHVGLLPTALALGGRARPGRTAEVRLTGQGGGVWRIPAAPGSPVGEPDVTLTADVLDYCYAAASRRDPDTLPRTVVGDRALAEDLLAVLTAFSHD